MNMKMKMKNNKTMLALVLVAALALCSVGVVAMADNNDAIIVTPSTTEIEEGETYEGSLTVVATAGSAELIINGTYTGTVSFYAVDPKITTNAEPFTVITCTNVTGVTFVNNFVDSTAGNVTVVGNTMGTIELVSGSVTLGTYESGSSLANYQQLFIGTLTTSYGNIVSGGTGMTTVSIVPVSGTVAAHLEISGAVNAIASDASVAQGISNAILGNDITISVDETTNKLSVSGTLGYIATNGTSAAGSAVAEYLSNANAEFTHYAMVFNDEIYSIVVNSTGVITDIKNYDGDSVFSNFSYYDFTDLIVSTTSATTPGVSGVTGALTIDADVTINKAITIGADAVVINNSNAIINETVTVVGQIINNGTIDLKKSAAGSGNITTYGMITSTLADNIATVGSLNAVMYSTTTTATPAVTTYYLVGNVSTALEAADSVTVFGYIFQNEDLTVDSTETIQMGYAESDVWYIDGTSQVDILGTFTNNGIIWIASEASLDVSNAKSIGTHGADAFVYVNGTLIIVSDGTVETSIGEVKADTAITTDTTTAANKIYTYTNLYNALTTTISGDIKLLCDATLNRSATLADGVTLLNNECDLTIAEDVTLTANGHFQFTGENVLTIDGELIINDATEPVVTAPVAGSFIGTDAEVILDGALTVSSGAKFITLAAINVPMMNVLSVNTALVGTINVAGEFTSSAAIIVDKLIVSGTMITDDDAADMAVNEATISGIYTETAGDFTASEKFTLSGTFTNTTGAAAFTDAVITGTLTATTGVTLNGTAYVGTAPTVFPYINEAIITSVNKITIGSDAAVVYYGDATDATDYFVATVISTVFYIGDDVFAVEFASDIGVALDLLKVEFTGYKLTGWYDAPVDGKIITANTGATIGASAYKAVYGYLQVLEYTLTLTYMDNVNWILDGQGVGASGTFTLAYGSHTLTVQPASGYTGDLGIEGISFGTGSTFMVDSDMTATVTGEVKEKTNGGMDLVTILLIIITIVIIIMAIIIALKLLRS